jgi:hypothetical protein
MPAGPMRNSDFLQKSSGLSLNSFRPHLAKVAVTACNALRIEKNACQGDQRKEKVGRFGRSTNAVVSFINLITAVLAASLSH